MRNDKLVRALIRLVRHELDCIEVLLEGEAPPAPAPDPTACPRCGEVERTQDTSTASDAGPIQRRLTCLTCGTSWRPPAPSLNENEENNGEPGRPQ